MQPENILPTSPPPGPPPLPPSAPSPVPTPGTTGRSWQNRLLTICIAIFTFEVGLFLVLFPWMEDTWKVNYLRSLAPWLQNLWDQAAFRGALTGLGLVNIYIALRQTLGLFRRS